MHRFAIKIKHRAYYIEDSGPDPGRPMPKPTLYTGIQALYEAIAVCNRLNAEWEAHLPADEAEPSR